MKVRTKEGYGEYNQILSVVFSVDISEENYNSERSMHSNVHYNTFTIAKTRYQTNVHQQRNG